MQKAYDLNTITPLNKNQQARSELTKALLIDLLTKECSFNDKSKQQAIGIVYPEYVNSNMPDDKVTNIKKIIQSPLSFMDFGLDELDMTDEHTDLFLSAMFRNNNRYIESNQQKINAGAIFIFQKCLGFAYQYHNKKSGAQAIAPQLTTYEDIRHLYTQPDQYNVPGYILGTTRSFVHLVIRKIEENSLNIEQLKNHQNGYESLLKAKDQRKTFINKDLKTLFPSLSPTYSDTDNQSRSAKDQIITIDETPVHFDYAGRVKTVDSTINKLNTNKNEMLSSHTDIIANRIVIQTKNTNKYIKQGMAMMRHLYQQHDFEIYPHIRYEIKGGQLAQQISQYLSSRTIQGLSPEQQKSFNRFKIEIGYPKAGYNAKTDDGYNELKIIMNGHEYQIRNLENNISNEARKAHHKLYDLGKIVEERTRGLKELETYTITDLLECLTHNIQNIQTNDPTVLNPYIEESKKGKTNPKKNQYASIILEEKLSQLGYEYNKNNKNPLRINKKLIQTKNSLLQSFASS